MTPAEILFWIGILSMCGFLGYGLGLMVSEIKEDKKFERKLEKWKKKKR